MKEGGRLVAVGLIRWRAVQSVEAIAGEGQCSARGIV